MSVEKRLDFGHFVDRVFWAVITATGVYVASQLKTLSESVQTLNEKVAVVVEKINYSERRQDASDRRVDKIEDQMRKWR